METYREKANKLYDTIMDDVRRNTVYSLFIYKPKKWVNKAHAFYYIPLKSVII